MKIYSYPDTDPSGDPWAYLAPAHLRLLEQSWAGVFRQHLQPYLPVEALTACFTKTGGRPRKDGSFMLGVLILQQLHDLTDAATVEAVAFNLAWHYALNIPPSTPLYICERTLRNYRRVVREHGLAPLLFQQLTDILLQHLAVDTSHQRIDSTTVRSAVRTLTRLGIVVETVGKFLRELGRREPVLYTSVAPEVIQLYVERKGEGCFAFTKAGEASRRLPEAVAVLGALVHQFVNTMAATFESYQLLRRVLSEQCEINRDASGTPIIQIKATAEISCESLQHPADPDSSYNAYKGQGYAVQIMETYAEDDTATGATATGATATEQSQPDLITHVAVYKMTQHDSQALAPAIADVRSRQRCPAQLLGDSHYGSTESVEQCQRERIALVAPAMPPKGSKQGQLTLEDFHLDAVGRVVACPQGHAPVWTSVSETKLAVRFDSVLCQACPNMHKCPGAVSAQPKKDGRWQYTHERVAQCHRRLAEQEPAFKALYRWRAGIEATMSRLKHQMRLAHLRVRGMAAVCYTVFLRALGLNVLRVAA
jgi:Transposase DDE domain/Transposase domain (DUF772)